MDTCPTCGDSFDTGKGMKVHHAQVHGGRLGGFGHVCAACGEEFTNKRRDAKYCSYECRRNRVEVECEWCGAVEEYPESIADGRRFCSTECQGKWQSDTRAGENHPSYSRVELTCEQCGETYRIKKSHASGSRFCSYGCKGEWMSERGRFATDENPMRGLTGEDSPFWQGGHERYYGANWIDQRDKRLERDGYRCQVCGDGESDVEYQLEVHHIQPIRTFDTLEDANTIDNLITLCRPCHRRWEGIPLRPDA